jgi:hypothetical protein
MGSTPITAMPHRSTINTITHSSRNLIMQKSSITINNYDNILTISVTDQSNTIDHVPAMVYKALVAKVTGRGSIYAGRTAVR